MSVLDERQEDGTLKVVPLTWKFDVASCCPSSWRLVHRYLGGTEWVITQTNRFDKDGKRLEDIEVAVTYCPFCGNLL